MEIFFFWLLFAVAVGVLAANRGRSGIGWFALSVAISPLLGAIFCVASKNLSAIAPANQQTHVKCPRCAELVLPEARVCKHCSGALTPQPGYTERMRAEHDSRENRAMLMNIGAVLLVVGIIAWMLVGR